MTISSKISTNYQPRDLDRVFDESVAKLIDGIQRALTKQLKRSINEKSPPPSAPYNPPHKLTGNLGRSITQTKVRSLGTSKFAMVRIDAPYATYLEFGATLKGGQPYFWHRKEGRIVYVRRSHPKADRFKKTKGGTLEPRPFVEPAVKIIRQDEIPKKLKTFFQRVRSAVKPGKMEQLA